jgi:F-type H+-transporting ATPase subunit delta
MRELIIARRYVKGLMDLAVESKEIDKLDEDMTLLSVALNQVPLLQRFLDDERVTIEQRSQVIKKISEGLAFSVHTRSALLILLERRRIALLGLIAVEVLNCILAYRKLARASARVASDSIAADVKGRIEEVMSKLLTLKVDCDTAVDSSLIGGFELKIGDLRYDASVSGELRRMKEKLINSEA